MARVIPNQNTWIGFRPLATGEEYPAVTALPYPTVADLNKAVDITCLTVSINASAQGNTVPTPSLCSLFETSVPGTSQAQFQGDFYRDDAADVAWDLLQRGVRGIFYISRFGGTGAAFRPNPGEGLEVWPVQITSRAAGPLASNTAQTFTVTAAVNIEPAENGIVDITAAAAPSGVTLTPATVQALTGIVQVTATGTNFTPGGDITIDGVSQKSDKDYVWVDSTTVTFGVNTQIVPSGGGELQVVAVNNAGSSPAVPITVTAALLAEGRGDTATDPVVVDPAADPAA